MFWPLHENLHALILQSMFQLLLFFKACLWWKYLCLIKNLNYEKDNFYGIRSLFVGCL